jgi:hypothetical protein
MTNCLRIYLREQTHYAAWWWDAEGYMERRSVGHPPPFSGG